MRMHASRVKELNDCMHACDTHAYRFRDTCMEPHACFERCCGHVRNTWRRGRRAHQITNSSVLTRCSAGDPLSLTLTIATACVEIVLLQVLQTIDETQSALCQCVLHMELTDGNDSRARGSSLAYVFEITRVARPEVVVTVHNSCVEM